MKRSGPLQRRTPLQGATLKGGAGSLARRTPPKAARAKRLAPRSRKREADMVQRRALVRELLRAAPVCQAQWKCCGAPAVDVHERLKRSRGGNILDPAQAHMVTVCRACHEATEAEVAEATHRRLLLPSWHSCAPGGIGPC